MEGCKEFNVGRATEWAFANLWESTRKLILRQAARPSIFQGTPRGITGHRSVLPGESRTWALLFGDESSADWATVALAQEVKG